MLEVLIKSGSLDSFGKTRNSLFYSIDDALAIASANRDDANSSQFSLFGAATTKRAEVYKDLPEWPHKEKLSNEREAVGFYLSGHPLDRYVDDAKKLGAVPTSELVTMRHNSEATITGIVAALKERKMKTGDGRWAVVTLEDTFGQAEVLTFSKVYEVAEPLLKAGEPVLIKGKVLIDDVDDEGKQLMPKMRAESVTSLADAQIQRTRFLDVVIDVPPKVGKKAEPSLSPRPEDDVVDEAAIAAVLEKVSVALQAHKGAVPARFKLEMPAGYVVVMQSGDTCRVTPSEDLVTALQRVKGVLSVVRS